jgi:hypothetical protein
VPLEAAQHFALGRFDHTRSGALGRASIGHCRSV